MALLITSLTFTTTPTYTRIPALYRRQLTDSCTKNNLTGHPKILDHYEQSGIKQSVTTDRI